MKFKTKLLNVLFLGPVLLGMCSIHASAGSGDVQDSKPRVYIYTLQLIPELLDLENWSEGESQIVSDHFTRLKNFKDEGIVILAGRIPVMEEEAFGIVIFRAESADEAVLFMENDPAVKEGIMTAKVYPFDISLIRAP